jgi:undecaprenyl phosphate N,N'-diacetylbacillosamine 1-phosphate transferase
MYSNFFKRLMDIIFSLIALPFFGILFIFVAPIIYFTDKGPVFYIAGRMGKNGKTFKMLKFRSMYVNAPDIRNPDGSTYNAEDDPRVTKIGRFLRKTSIDELPQIINVLKGDMSLVGPRPNLPSSPEKIATFSENEKKRIKVKPGITGYTQAYFRNSIPSEEKFKYDAYYVDHMNFWMDAKIIFQTIKSVVQKENIYINTASSNENITKKL